MPEAARISDMHVCPKVEGSPHVGGPVFAGSANVLIGYLPAARVGDAMVCFPVGPSDSIKTGAGTVLINHRSAARRSDPGSHIAGDLIVQGCPSVLIGDTPQSFVLRAAARRGTPFCEECERKRREREAAAAAAGEAADDPPPAPPDAETLSLSDAEPPPGVRDPLTGVTATRAALAGQIGGDELDGVRKAARYAEAYQFYFKHGDRPVKPARIWSHVGGIDIDKPVEVVDVRNRTLYQRGFPGSDKNGEYFAEDPNVTPEQLGTSSVVGVDRNGERELVARDRRTIEYNDNPTPGLKSTAAPIRDFWSIRRSGDQPAQIVDCEGGGAQIMIPRAFHAASTTAIR
jgi:uncharacterized Zn-binding protein involved in type VI secretion